MSEKMTVNCDVCGNPFETYRLKLLEVDRPLSTVCYKCREEKNKAFEQSEAEREETEKLNRRTYWLAESGIPKLFIRASFDNFDAPTPNAKKIKTLCAAFADNFPVGTGRKYKSLGVFSARRWGNGKTHLACAAARRVMERWPTTPQSCPVLFVTEPDMFRRVRSAFNKNQGSYETHETEEMVINQLAAVPLLIIDDVGKEEVADPRFVQRVWFSVVNKRYEGMKPLLFTANLDPDELAYHLGGSRGNEATFDRLCEMCGGEFFENTCTGRRQNA